MESFGTLLKTYLNDENISLNTFSKAVGINRGTLHGILSGERKADEDKFQLIMNNLPLPIKKQNKLSEAYFAEKYGTSNFRRVLRIAENFRLLSETNEQACVKIITPEIKNEDFIIISSAPEINGAAEFILSQADKNNSVVVTNFPYTCSDIDSVVYQYLKKSEAKELVNHIIKLSDRNKSSHNTDSLFASIKYAKLHVSPRYIIAETDSDCTGNGIYPYYFISRQHMLLINADFDSGILFSSGDRCTEPFNDASAEYGNASPLYIFPENILELQTILNTHYKKTIEKVFSCSPCIMRFADRELFETVANKDLQNRDVLIHMAVDWYSTLFKNKQYNVINSYDSWISFGENGIINEFPESLISRIPLDLRKNILNRQIKLLKESTEAHSDTLNSEKITIPEDVCIEVFTEGIVISLRIPDGINSFSGNALANIEIKGLADDFLNTADYLEHSGMFLTNKDLAENLSLLINKCESDSIASNKILFK